MITPNMKARAVGMLRGGMSVNEVAGELDLPLGLVHEWYKSENITIIDNIQATTTAMAKLQGTVVDDTASERIKAGLERVAEQLVDQLEIVSLGDDLQKAHVLKLCSESALKLYAAFVAPQANPTNSLAQLSDSGLSTFQLMMKD